MSRDQGGYYGVPGALRSRIPATKYFGPDKAGVCGLCGSKRWHDFGLDEDRQRVLRCARCAPVEGREIIEGSFWELRRAAP